MSSLEAISHVAAPAPPIPVQGTDNATVALALDRVAHLLREQGASPFRTSAWERAAEVIRTLDRSVGELLAEGGLEALDRLPGIGVGLAGAIDELVRTGRLGFLSRLEGEQVTHGLFARVPGIGPTFARRITADLGIHTLEELELAAHDGRLARVRGFGDRRVQAVRAFLDATLRTSAWRRATAAHERPTVASLLAVDGLYRDLVARDALPKIAPRRFNPDRASWLPVLHVDRDGWHFTALYSNTERAHRLRKDHDWVVVYAGRDGREVQHTVVTETHGAQAGQRVVRGREHERR